MLIPRTEGIKERKTTEIWRDLGATQSLRAGSVQPRWKKAEGERSTLPGAAAEPGYFSRPRE